MDNNTPPIRPPLKDIEYVKALSIRQPFLDAIFSNKKTLELRPSKSSHIGRLYLHAPKTEHGHHPGLSIESCTFGAILGHVDMIGMIPLNHADFIDTKYMHLYDTNEAFLPQFPLYGWLLKNPVKFDKPIPYKGQLGIFNIPADVVS